MGAYENVGKLIVTDDDEGLVVGPTKLLVVLEPGTRVMVLAIVTVDVIPVVVAEGEAGVVDAIGSVVAVIKHFQRQSAISLQA